MPARRTPGDVGHEQVRQRVHGDRRERHRHEAEQDAGPSHLAQLLQKRIASGEQHPHRENEQSSGRERQLLVQPFEPCRKHRRPYEPRARQKHRRHVGGERQQVAPRNAPDERKRQDASGERDVQQDASHEQHAQRPGAYDRRDASPARCGKPAPPPTRQQQRRDGEKQGARVQHVDALAPRPCPRIVHRLPRPADGDRHHPADQVEEPDVAARVVVGVAQRHDADAALGQQAHAGSVVLHLPVVGQHKLAVVPRERRPAHAVIRIALGVGNAVEEHAPHAVGGQHARAVAAHAAV